MDYRPDNGRSPTKDKYPNWSMYLQYQKDNDGIIVTLLPRSATDVVNLEKMLPQIFENENSQEQEYILDAILNAQSERIRKESEQSTGSRSAADKSGEDLRIMRNLINCGF